MVSLKKRDQRMSKIHAANIMPREGEMDWWQTSLRFIKRDSKQVLRCAGLWFGLLLWAG